jgi:hypothetical protein
LVDVHFTISKADYCNAILLYPPIIMSSEIIKNDVNGRIVFFGNMKWSENVINLKFLLVVADRLNSLVELFGRSNIIESNIILYHGFVEDLSTMVNPGDKLIIYSDEVYGFKMKIIEGLKLGMDIYVIEHMHSSIPADIVAYITFYKDREDLHKKLTSNTQLVCERISINYLDKFKSNIDEITGLYI